METYVYSHAHGHRTLYSVQFKADGVNMMSYYI